MCLRKVCSVYFSAFFRTLDWVNMVLRGLVVGRDGAVRYVLYLRHICNFLIL